MLQPGKPQAKQQAVCTAEWERKRLIAYVSGTALVILADVDKLLQTIYHDEELCAVAIDETTGKLAVCAGGKVFIYGPNGRGEGFLKWLLQSSIELDPSDGNIQSLSWGDANELLVGSASLTLWSTSPSGVKLLWRRPLANPAKLALFCYDATLVASVGEYDRLVKVWRRLSIGSEDVQFDFSYLPHPRAVTAMHWRKPFHREQSIDNVLYTIGADAVLRVWAPVYPHDLHLLQLWAVIDLQDSIPGFIPDTAGEEEAVRRQSKYVMIIDSSVFAVAAETAVNTASAGEKDREVLQRLIEVANRSPEICVVFDGRGRMSAWGLENVGCKTRKTTNVFSILHTENSWIEAVLAGEESDRFVQFHVFPGGTGLTILAHFFDGRICWFNSRIDRLLDPSPRAKRLELVGVLSGHSKPIQTLVRTADGKAMLTLTRDNEHIVWTQSRGDNINLVRRSSLAPGEHVHRAVVLDSGNFVMTLHYGHVVLWNTSQPAATEVSRLSFSCSGKMLCLLLLPEAEDNLKRVHVVALSSEMKGIAWEIGLPRGQTNKITNSSSLSPYLREFTKFTLDQKHDLLMILPVDPVGWNATLSGTLDTFSREVAVTVNASGLLQSWTAKISQEADGSEPSLRWLATSTVDTSISTPSLAKGNSIRKIALVNTDRSELTIWDSRAAQLEYHQHFESQDVICDLDWTSTPDSQSILAVGFPHRVLLMCQLRYDYLNAGPAWAPFREVRIRDLTPHPIGDSLWLSNGGLVIGAGNQLFVYSRKIEDRDDLFKTLQLSSHKARLNDVFEIVSHLNGPVPVYHPQFLQQCILAGKHALVEEILVRLHKELRNYHEEIPLDNFLDIPTERFLESGDEIVGQTMRKQKFSGFFNYTEDEEEFTTFDEALAASLCDLLKKIAIPNLTGTEQIMLAGIVECFAQVKLHRRSIDENGARYMLFFRQHLLRREKPVVDMSFREVVWAFHSSSQEILVDLVNRNAQNRMLWAQARESGIFMWLRDADAVKKQFEVVARNAYTRTNEKNPIDCSLHYLALKKKGVLLGLWRMASWNREQGSTMRFLGNDFREGRWKTAALKNAYALLGKHRFEYAAAFFLLADSLKDAVNVCFNQLKDMQLAIAIARVYEGDHGPVLKSLLEDRILPLATKEGNHWLATWAFWMLKRKDKAVQSLLSPLPSVMEATHVHIESRSFTADDPALVILYKQIREKTLQTLRGAAKISPEAESQFVLHTARLYDRMGCDLLALDLVKNWDFLPPNRDTMKPLIQLDPRRHHMRRRSSVTVADLPPPDQAGEKPQAFSMATGLVKPPVAVFEEPDMSWAF